MFRFPRWSNRRKAAAAVTLALLLWIPQGISQSTQPVVTGHSTFYNGQGYDPCLASIAGIVKTQVMWFNDMVLAERYGGAGDYIYVAENGSRDPRPNLDGVTYLFSDGTFYDFVDPNGAHWHVDELYYAHVDGGADLNTPKSSTVPTIDEDKTYVWTVELSPTPIHDRFAGNPNGANFHDIYNFLDMVDTCKFHNNTATYAGTVVHQGDDLSINYGHPVGATPHTHSVHLANIWIGPQPVVVPVGQNTTGDASWSSQWSDAGNAQNAPYGYTGQGGTP